jgi:hypothetical protein
MTTATQLMKSLGVALVFVITSSVTAECAWVMWGQKKGTTVEPFGGGHVTAQDCQSVLSEMAQNAQKQRQKVTVDRGFVMIGDTSFICLPDTVDPRPRER